MNLRPYQARAVDFLAARNGPAARALCVCPAGGGKTIIGASALAITAQPWDRIGWACNTREQVEQGTAALNRAGVRAAWVKCVAGLTAEDVVGLDFLVMDEVHHVATAKTWQMLFALCPGVVWGLTATPPTDIEVRMFWDGLWGDNVIVIPRSEVNAGGHLAKGRVVFLKVDEMNEFRDQIDTGCAEKLFLHFQNWKQVKSLLAPFIRDANFVSEAAIAALTVVEKSYPLEFRTVTDRQKWVMTRTLTLSSPSRNAAAVAIATKEVRAGKTGLLLVESIELGHELAAKIPSAIMVHSRMGIKARRKAMEDVRSGAIRCMVATSLADEGLDIPRLSFLVSTSIAKSPRLAEQRSGRVLRLFEGKEEGVIYDFTDIASPMAKRNAEARRRVYKQLGYAVEVMEGVA